jgi:hypothetical protein
VSSITPTQRSSVGAGPFGNPVTTVVMLTGWFHTDGLADEVMVMVGAGQLATISSEYAEEVLSP